MMGCARKISLDRNGHQHHTKLKSIDRFGIGRIAIRVILCNFMATTLRYSVKFGPFSHVFIFGNMFPGSHGFVAMSPQAVTKKHVQIIPF